MIIIKVNKEKSIDFALKLYKNKVQKIRQIQELKDRKEFKKPSIKNREQKLKAIFNEKFKNGPKN
jgi:small subunit ribosomal protein S21